MSEESNKTVNLLFLLPQGIVDDETGKQYSYASHEGQAFFSSTTSLNAGDEKNITYNVVAKFEADIDYRTPDSLRESARKLYELSCLFLAEQQLALMAFREWFGDKLPMDFCKGKSQLLNEYQQVEKVNGNLRAVEFISPNGTSRTVSSTEVHNDINHSILDAQLNATVNVNDIDAVKQLIQDLYLTSVLIHETHKEMVMLGEELFKDEFKYQQYHDVVEKSVQEVLDKIQDSYENAPD